MLGSNDANAQSLKVGCEQRKRGGDIWDVVLTWATFIILFVVLSTCSKPCTMLPVIGASRREFCMDERWCRLTESRLEITNEKDSMLRVYSV